MSTYTPESQEAIRQFQTGKLAQHVKEISESETLVEMPKYKCHKQVWALKISDVRDPSADTGNESDGSRILIFERPGFGPIGVDHSYVHKHKPQAGGYYVVYEDGYKSWSPAEAFEGGYTEISKEAQQ